MRLLLDEHYSKLIAEQLRERGHGVVAAAEREDLTGLSDHEIFVLMSREHRTIVTENWSDFQRETHRAESDGLDHSGVVFTSSRRMPRGKRTVGLFVRVLHDLLERNPADDALKNTYRWLPD